MGVETRVPHLPREKRFDTQVPPLPGGWCLKTNHFSSHQHLRLEHWLLQQQAAGPVLGYSRKGKDAERARLTSKGGG